MKNHYFQVVANDKGTLRNLRCFGDRDDAEKFIEQETEKYKFMFIQTVWGFNPYV
jgi:hypothetical protein